MTAGKPLPPLAGLGWSAAARILQSLVAEQRRGRPGPAREAALAAADADPANARQHLIDAACASLVAGEPRRALATLDLIDSGGPAWLERRVAACRVWGTLLDRNWYPGATGADLVSVDLPSVEEAEPVEPVTDLIDAVVAHGLVPLLSTREIVANASRRLPGVPGMVDQLTRSAQQRLDVVAERAVAVSAPFDARWARVAQADLAWRSDQRRDALDRLAQIRRAAAAAGDGAGVSYTHMVEGDWWSGAASPESLGLQLTVSPPGGAPPLADWERSLDCWQTAVAGLAISDEPRMRAAVALRLAFAAREGGRHRDVADWLAEASAGFDLAGDAAGTHLTTIHRLLAELARGRVAAVRREAGSGWALEPRGPIAGIRAWAGEHGSASYCTGLGRLLERTAQRWAATGAFEQAAAAYSCAAPLIGVSNVVPVGRALAGLAETDAKRGFVARSVVRYEQASAHLPTLIEAQADPLQWLEHLNLLMSISLGTIKQLTMNAAPSRIRAQEGMQERLRGAAGTDPGVDPAATSALVGQMVQGEVILAIARAWAEDGAGWVTEAERWFGAATEIADKADPEHAWLAVLSLAAAGREAEAQERLIRVQTTRPLPDDMLAALALRARMFPVAAELFKRADAAGALPVTWADLLDRAEVALETGDAAGSLRMSTAGIEQFEQEMSRLTRDPDRLALADDVKVAALYLMACRACIVLADRAPDAAARQGHLDRCLALTDRIRSLPLLSLLSQDGTAEPSGGRGATGHDDHDRSRRWQETATIWSAAFDRLYQSYATGNRSDRERIAATLTAADDQLVAIEAEIEEAGGAPLAGFALPELVDGAAVRSALPEGVCLLECHVVRRDLLVLGVTASGTVARYCRLPKPGIEPLVRQLWQSCDAGSAGPEAADLAAFLLDPVADLIETHRRVLIVPFGSLNGLPFHVLPFDGGPLGDGERRVVSYLPAASLVVRHPVDRRVPEGPVVVVGDPAFSAEVNDRIGRLPGAAIEAEVVARVHSTMPLIGEGATEAALRSRLPGAAVIHLAAHGHLDDVAPGTSSIVLAGTDELTVADLIGMRLDADLAILSACDSGRGTVTLGGDVVGLARGLIVAGVTRSVVSLWPVDDAIAAVIMEAFHRHLVAGSPPAEALAVAQMELRGLTAEAIADRYRSLGGVYAGPDRRLSKRGVATSVPIGRSALMPIDPEFLDVDEPESDVSLDGTAENVWAAFVLIGP